VNEKFGSIPAKNFYEWYCQTFQIQVNLESYAEKKKLLDALVSDCNEFWNEVEAGFLVVEGYISQSTLADPC
jgi:hypothetical protein